MGDLQQREPSDQGHVARTKLRSALRVGRLAGPRIAHIGPLKRIIDQRHIETHAECLGKIVAENQVGDGTVQKIRVGARYLAAFKLDANFGSARQSPVRTAGDSRPDPGSRIV